MMSALQPEWQQKAPKWCRNLCNMWFTSNIPETEAGVGRRDGRVLKAKWCTVMVQRLPLNTENASYRECVTHREPTHPNEALSIQLGHSRPLYLHRVPHPNSIQMSSIMSYLEGTQSYMTEMGGYFYTSDKNEKSRKNISTGTLY